MIHNSASSDRFYSDPLVLHTGLITSNVDQNQILFEIILPAVSKSHFDLTREEIESMYWKVSH